jgi:hypothetical protein
MHQYLTVLSFGNVIVMGRLASSMLCLFLMFALLFVQKVNVPLVKGSPSIYQGDLILTGNNVTTIEGRFDINGSIIVQDNATLMLKNAFLNFTQINDYQYYIWLKLPSGGNPHLLAYNSTITSTSNYSVFIYMYANSTTTIDNCTCTSCNFGPEDHSVLSISNSSVYFLQPTAFSVVNINESTIEFLHNHDYSETKVYNSEIDTLLTLSRSVKCTISKLEPSFFSYWSFIDNCSVTIQSGGYAPNITLTETKVNGWRFCFYGSSNATIINSTINSVGGYDSSVTYLKSTTVNEDASAQSSSMLVIEDSILKLRLWAYDSSDVWLLNSTRKYLNIYYSGKVHFSWYLNVHVKDSVDQAVPFANVTATFPNATVADSKQTDATGWAAFPLMEKMVNATGEYPIGNYTVKAEYGLYSKVTTVNMTGTQETILQLPFTQQVIPEFPSFLAPSLLAAVTVIGTLLYKKKQLKSTEKET